MFVFMFVGMAKERRYMKVVILAGGLGTSNDLIKNHKDSDNLRTMTAVQF